MSSPSSKRTITRVLGLILITYSLIISKQVLAAKELSFCPAGGPTGWLNHFDYKRDKNILSQYQRRYPGRPFPYPMKSPHARYHHSTPAISSPLCSVPMVRTAVTIADHGKHSRFPFCFILIIFITGSFLSSSSLNPETSNILFPVLVNLQRLQIS